MRFNCTLAAFLLLLVNSTKSLLYDLPIRYLSKSCYGTSINGNTNPLPYYFPMTYLLNGCFKTRSQHLCCIDLYEVNCVAMCTDSCPNGRWDSFNTCTCNSGYFIVGGKCTPACSSCTNGTCVAPNQCVCHEGYSMVNNRCVAICNPPCVNGFCNKLGECTCFKGFVKSTYNNCEPFCNQRVLDVRNKKCIAPNTLRCNEGFRIGVGASNRINCTPKFGIKNCPPGFEQNGTSLSRSDPVCDLPCTNANCVAPNKCECLTGYEKSPNIDHTCTPACTSEIVNCTFGTCVAPNMCTCFEGYRLTTDHQLSYCEPNDQSMKNGTVVRKCFEGYELGEGEQCIPVCQPECINGTCNGPNKCECLPGYEKSSNMEHTCTPACATNVVNCTFGTCVAPNICTCSEGYRLITVDRLSYCELQDQSMEEGTDIPQCFEGYELGEGEQCLPVCRPDCANGICTAPNTCECLAGFEKIPNKDQVCIPACASDVVNCTFGTCVAPNICTCFGGYHLTTVDRLSYCELSDQSMEEGTVIPQCFEGYELGEGEQCIPVCQPECTNGTCSAPNTCECNEGFTKTANGSCAISCDSRCTNESGTCTGSKCKCKDGYGNTESELYCSPVPQLCSGNDCNDDYVYDENIYVNN